MLAFHNYIEHSDANILYDNESLFRICSTKLGIEDPDYTHINKIIAVSASSVLSGMRFGHDGNYTVSKFLSNMVPYPRIHFLQSSFAPFMNGKSIVEEYSTEKITSSAVEDISNYLYCNETFGKPVSL